MSESIFSHVAVHTMICLTRMNIKNQYSSHFNPLVPKARKACRLRYMLIGMEDNVTGNVMYCI